MVLEGQHVRLEPLAERHLADLLPLVQGPRETFAVTWVPRDEAGLRQYLEVALEEQRLGVSLPFATVDRRRGKAVGSTRFMTIDFWAARPGSALARPPGVPHAVEIGHTWLGPQAQRTALNTEAKYLMLRHAFETWGCVRVELKTNAMNYPSRTAILRIGAREEGTLRKHLISERGIARDTVYFSILDTEWPTARAGLEARMRARGWSA